MMHICTVVIARYVGKNISRDYEKKTFFCAQCGTQLHQRAFTEEEIHQALFDEEMDRYED